MLYFLGQKDFIRKIELALENGHTLLIEEVQSIKRAFDGNEVDSRKVIGKIVSLSSSNEGGLKEKKSKIFSTRLAIQQVAVLKRN